MQVWVAGLIFACGAATAENLLLNSGIEALNGNGQPLYWDIFIEPAPGVAGEVREGYQGGNALYLAIPRPYEEDPTNNWSQSIVRDFSGKTLRVSAMIRAVDATEAAVWLQCWSERPARVIAAQTSSTSSLVHGDADWTKVELEMKAPEGTAFLMVRCVLKGQGEAWFDDIELVDVAAPAPETSEETPEDEPEETPPPEPAPVEAPTPSPDVTELRQSVQDLREANAVLLERFRTIQDELGHLRQDLTRPAPPAQPAATPPEPQEPAPDLSEMETNLAELRAENARLLEEIGVIQQELGDHRAREQSGDAQQSAPESDAIETKIEALTAANAGLLDQLAGVQRELEGLRADVTQPAPTEETAESAPESPAPPPSSSEVQNSIDDLRAANAQLFEQLRLIQQDLVVLREQPAPAPPRAPPVELSPLLEQMQENVSELRAENEALLDQLRTMQREIEGLRTELSRPEPAPEAPEPANESVREPAEYGPPLVPRLRPKRGKP